MFSLKRIFAFRVLTATLVAKDLKSRYRGSVLGLLWTLLNPLLLMLVYTLVFSFVMRGVQVENYAVFVFAGLLPWLWFSTSLTQSTVSVIQDGHLIKKVRFPTEILPFVTVASNFVNFLFSLVLYFVFCIIFSIPLGWPVLFLPLLILLSFLIQYGFGLILAALTVVFRDVEHLTGNILTLLFFLTPILYPLTMVPEGFRKLATANPLTPLILSYRDVLFFNRPPQLGNLVWLAVLALILGLVGELTFTLLSPRFAEEV